MLERRLCLAVHDYRWLLDHGYPRTLSLEIVTRRYMLSRRERLLLYRCVHDGHFSSEVMRKHVPANYVTGGEIAIDGYNALLTIITAISGGQVLLCDDGFVRDLRGSKVKRGEEEVLRRAAREMGMYIRSLSPREVVVVLDAAVSHSAVHAHMIADEIGRLCRGRVVVRPVLARRVDSVLGELASSYVIASSDAVVLSRARLVFDIAGRVVTGFIKGVRLLSILPCLYASVE